MDPSDTDTSTVARATPQDDADLRRLVAEAVRTQDDTDALMALHDEGAVVVNFGGRRVLGRESLREAMAAALATPLEDVRTEVEVVDVRLVTGDVALVSRIKHVDDRRPAAERTPLPSSSGSLSYVAVRRAEGWRIALAHTTPVLG